MHIMIDIETLGGAPDGCLIQVGWATFDMEKVHDSGAYTIAASDSQSQGMRIDASTVKFWMDQPKDVREQVMKGEYTLSRALNAFGMAHPWLDYEGVWTNAPLFDFAIMRDAYKRVGNYGINPWTYRQERCSRTLFQVAKYKANKSNIVFNLPERKGKHHDAEDDAVYQAEVVIYLMEIING